MERTEPHSAGSFALLWEHRNWVTSRLFHSAATPGASESLRRTISGMSLASDLQHVGAATPPTLTSGGVTAGRPLGAARPARRSAETVFAEPTANSGVGLPARPLPVVRHQLIRGRGLPGLQRGQPGPQRVDAGTLKGVVGHRELRPLRA